MAGLRFKSGLLIGLCPPTPSPVPSAPSFRNVEVMRRASSIDSTTPVEFEIFQQKIEIIGFHAKIFLYFTEDSMG
jgi:hypothetical protein